MDTKDKYLEENVALVDMDGTLADYERGILESMSKLCNPKDLPVTVDHDHDNPPHIEALMKLVKSKGEWWENLPRFQLGFDVLEILRELDFYITILTQGPKANPVAWSHKVLWCMKEVPDLDITITRNKGIVYGKILVDDYPEYINGWLLHRKRGLVIMPANPWNEKEKVPSDFCWDRVIRYDGSNLDEVRDAITKVKNRKAGEDWI